MKTGILPGITQVMLMLAVCFSFLPLILYWCKRLAENKAYMIISIFWMINGILYLPDIFHWSWYEPITVQITVDYNLVDAPIIFLIFYYVFDKKIFLYMIPAFLCFDVFVIAWKGFNLTSNRIIITVGSLLCLMLNIWGISRYLRKVKHTDEETVLAFVFAAFIFYYGLCVDIVLISKFLGLNVIQGNSIMLINYIAILLATILISIGFLKYANPSSEFAKE